MLIRRLTRQDTARYRTLRLEALRLSPAAFSSSYEEQAELPISQFEARLTQGEGEFILGAFDDGELVGIAGLSRESCIKLAHKAWVEGMYVAPSHRGQRVGEKLLQQLISAARDIQGLSTLLLDVAVDNLEAKQLYSRVGFIEQFVERDAMRINGCSCDEARMTLNVE